MEKRPTDSPVKQWRELKAERDELRERVRQMKEVLRRLREWADNMPKSDEWSSTTTEGEKAVAIIDDVLDSEAGDSTEASLEAPPRLKRS